MNTIISTNKNLKETLQGIYAEKGSLRAVSETTGMSVSGIYRYVKDVIKQKKNKKERISPLKNLPQKMPTLKTDVAVVAASKYKTVSKKSIAAASPIDSVVSLSYRLEKFKIRRWIVDMADIMLGNKVSAITFPGSEWAMERDLLIKCGSKVKKITAIERDRGIYDFSANNTPPANNIEFLCKSDAELFSAPATQPYNLMWLDYMGPFINSKLDAFRLACKNGYIADKSLVCLTFLNGRDGSMAEAYKAYASDAPVGRGKYNDARLMVIPNMYAGIAAEYGFSTFVAAAYRYKERQGGVPKSPMLFIAMVVQKEDSSY